MLEFSVSPEFLALAAGAVLSLLFSYIPGLNGWYAGKAPEVKRLAMAGLLLVIAVVLVVLGCYGIIQTGVVCSQAGIVQVVWSYLLALAANQSTYAITPQVTAVKNARS
jgi:hypothetical protein